MSRIVSILCANLKGNLGDFAIAEAIAINADRILGSCKIQLYYHANKAVDEARMKVMLEETTANFDSIQAAPYFRRPSWLRTLCRMGIAKAYYTKRHNQAVSKVARQIQVDRAFIDRVADSDLIIFAGGAQWGRGDLNLNMFAQLQAVSGGKCPVRAFPFSMSNATVSCNGKAGLQALMSQLDAPIFVRDGISHRCLRSIGVDTDLVSDCVFSLSGAFDSKWENDSPEAGESRRVYLSLTQSGDTDAQSVAALVRSLKEASLIPVLFSTCEIEDRSFYESVQACVSVDAIYPLSWKQAVGKLSTCRFVITNRLHCLIFSALSGTPVVPVTNRAKSKAYVKDADLPYSLEGVNSIEATLLEAINQNLKVISQRQIAYATACGDIMNKRLPELFLPRLDSAEVT